MFGIFLLMVLIFGDKENGQYTTQTLVILGMLTVLTAAEYIGYCIRKR